MTLWLPVSAITVTIRKRLKNIVSNRDQWWAIWRCGDSVSVCGKCVGPREVFNPGTRILGTEHQNLEDIKELMIINSLYFVRDVSSACSVAKSTVGKSGSNLLHSKPKYHRSRNWDYIAYMYSQVISTIVNPSEYAKNWFPSRFFREKKGAKTFSTTFIKSIFLQKRNFWSQKGQVTRLCSLAYENKYNKYK